MGYSQRSDYSMFATLWVDGTALDLNSLFTLPPNITLTDAVGINDNGWIAANGIDNITGFSHAYLLSTVPLPTAAWFFGSGLLGLTSFARIRKTA